MHKLATLSIGHTVGDGSAIVHTPRSIDAIIERALRAQGIDAYTVTRARGMWQGDAEESTVVSVVVRDIEGIDRIERGAAEIARLAMQDCVMMTMQDVSMAFISAPVVADTA